ncbi:putative palmitoyltransferase ZDHHC9/14/18 [Paratrimastix pyriformis]|uniref:Palmitoyltransferase n=1 Tax=Paratrimastix pyriformis TaxID=342808 RepID=A0ABQ8UNE6_9EUKA|nr:putative palmitoyltransferase ZDHHC9/14/18 [Paratrimastix pyriformis]
MCALPLSGIRPFWFLVLFVDVAALFLLFIPIGSTSGPGRSPFLGLLIASAILGWGLVPIFLASVQCMDPGMLPKRFQFPLDNQTAFLGQPPGTVPQESGDFPLPVSAPSLEFAEASGGAEGGPRIIGGKICPECQIWRPQGTKHCYVCGACIERFDHHCDVIGNCVGSRNHGVFLYFLLSTATACILYAITSGLLIWRPPGFRTFSATSGGITGHPVLFVFLLVTSMLAVLLSLFSCFHMGLICADATTVGIAKQAKEGHPCSGAALRRFCWPRRSRLERPHSDTCLPVRSSALAEAIPPPVFFRQPDEMVHFYAGPQSPRLVV